MWAVDLNDELHFLGKIVIGNQDLHHLVQSIFDKKK